MAFLLIDAWARKMVRVNIIYISDFLLLITILPLTCFRRYCLAFVCLFSRIFSHENIFLKYLMSFAYCIHSIVSNSQGVKIHLFSSGNNIPQVMIQLNAIHQYNLGTTNTDFKMFGIQTNVGISTAGMFYMQIMYLHFTVS